MASDQDREYLRSMKDVILFRYLDESMLEQILRISEVTVTDTVLLKLHRQDFIRFIKNQPAAGIKMLMIIIYSLLRKLRETNQELAFERKTHFNQEDVDSFIEGIMKE